MEMGLQTRSFCYVDDLIDGFIKLMNGEISGPVNLGNPKEMTILELANKIISKINPELDIIYKEIPKDDPSRRKPDISLATNKLSWSPKVTLNDGLDETIDFFRASLK